MRCASPTVREGALMHLGALPDGRATVPQIHNTLVFHYCLSPALRTDRQECLSYFKK
jgi:hypothetical protein